MLIHRCGCLLGCGKILEKKLLGDLDIGTFTAEKKAVLKGFVGITWAALIIYPTIIGAWSYVACMGLQGFAPGDARALVISVSIMLFFIIAGKIVNTLQIKQLGL